jgi:ATP-dependent exoDNAse (exonuclease V) beta subunit
MAKVNSFIIDDMTFSFSRLNSFHQCKHLFYLQYIECLKGESNFFAEYGSYAHEILEKYAKGELESYELSTEYKNNYSKSIIHPAPPNKYVNLEESYFEAGLDYFDNFDGFDGFDVLAIEKEVDFQINNIKITGFIDLLVKDKDNKLHIIDHKSSDPKSAKSKKAQEYWGQMYLYSIPIIEEYDQYPSQLHINAFRKKDWFTIDFDKKGIDKIKKWVIDTVELIKNEEEWNPTINEFFCSFLCNHRNRCEYRWGQQE